MSWRPEDWVNPYNGVVWQSPEKYAFEEGADAMLAALRKSEAQNCEVFKGEIMTMSGQLVPITAFRRAVD